VIGDKTLPITGGCLCGAVRYASSEQPSDSNYCHCQTCQKANGAPVTAAVKFPIRAFRFTQDEPTFFKSSEFAERGFCARCGSRLIYRSLASESWESVFIEVGTLDRPEDTPPKWHTGVESQMPWLTITDDLPRLRTKDNPNVPAFKEAADQGEK
jgi:hypothetical protein